jgi:hypothetical protein
MPKNFCFCTLAVGKRYRTHALFLAQDIQQHSPETLFVILTDKPSDFSQCSNVLAVQHHLESIKGYHDKRFAVEKALSLFETCIFLDSDVRLLGAFPEDIEWQPGITARHGCGILKHNTRKAGLKELSIIEEIAKTLHLNLQDTKWIHEFFFVVRKDNGVEASFLKQWGKIATYFEMNGVYDGDGNVIGLAASQTQFPIRLDSVDRFAFFKDNIEKERIKNKQANPNEKLDYFKAHHSIEYPHLFWIQKVLNKGLSYLKFRYRLLKLRIQTLRKPLELWTTETLPHAGTLDEVESRA